MLSTLTPPLSLSLLHHLISRPTFSFVFLLLFCLRKPFLFLTYLASLGLTSLVPSLHSWVISLLGSPFPLSPSEYFLSTSAEVPCSFMLSFSCTCSNSCMLKWTALGFEEVSCGKKNSRRGKKNWKKKKKITILDSSSGLAIIRQANIFLWMH